jgi:hypothetical protein
MRKTITIFLLIIISLATVSCKLNDETKEETKEVKKTSSLDSLPETPIKNDFIPIIQSPSCVPYNEPIEDVGLITLLKNLKQSIEKKDTTLLLSVMDSNVIISHGGGEYGYYYLLNNWKNGTPDIWTKLDILMNIGGSKTIDSVYRFPYFTNYDKCNNLNQKFWDGEDPYWTYMTIKDTVNLYSSSDSNSDVKAKMVNAFVNVKDYSTFPDNGYLKVTTYDNELVGYVKSNEVYRTGDYNLIVELDSTGKWSVTSFAPYD